MKIPGLDDALSKLDKFDEMMPLLESINNAVKILAEVQIHDASMTYPMKEAYRGRLKEETI